MIERKFATILYVLREQGLRGIVERILWRIKRYRTSDHLWMGKIVELLGNRATLDGCQFDLSSPVIGSAQKAGFLTKTYEGESRQLLRLIPSHLELPIIELGGSVGVLACISHHYFGRPSEHVVVEANPALIPVLTRNRDLNQASFDIISAALAYDKAEITFHVHPKFVSSSLYAVTGDTTAVSVPTVTFKALVEKLYSPNSVILLCDIEGAEYDLFLHEFDLIQRCVKYLAIEFHPSLTGQESVTTMLQQLTDSGFIKVYQNKDDFLFCNDRI